MSLPVLIGEAAAEIAEMTDIIEETEWEAMQTLPPTIQAPLRDGVARGVAGVAGTATIPQAIGTAFDAFSTPKKVTKSRAFNQTPQRSHLKRSRMGRVHRRFQIPLEPHSRFSALEGRTMPFKRRPVRRKRKTYGKVRRGSRYTSKELKVGLASSRIARNQRSQGSYKVIKKLTEGITPTVREGGSTLTTILRNAGSKTVPNSLFGFSWHFRLDQFPNYADYVDIYQWYKILYVKVHFYPLNNSHPSLIQSTATNPIVKSSLTSTSNLTATQAPEIVLAKDHLTDALFASQAEAMGHAGSIYHCFNNGNDLSVFVAPKPTGLIGPSGSEVIYEVPNSRWITTSNVTLPHYGLRAYMTSEDGNQVRVIMEMAVAFKHPKV